MKTVEVLKGVEVYCVLRGGHSGLGAVPCGCASGECKLGLDREPAEPDGECFRGGEAAAYEAEQQAWIQRNLK